MKRFFLTSFLLHFTLYTFSQIPVQGETYKYARSIVDTLASPEMHGRGYVSGGDSIAAHYLRAELKSLGVQPTGNDYYQKFSFPINTFPGKMSFNFFTTDDKCEEVFDFKPGENFIVGSNSPGCKDDFLLKVVDSNLVSSSRQMKRFLKRVSKRDFLLVDDRNVFDKEKVVRLKEIKENKCGASGIIVLDKKLTWHQSQQVAKFPVVHILSEDFTHNCKEYGGSINIENKFIESHKTQNVIGYVKGSVYPDSFIIYSAHYDHLGHMGTDVYFPGANDNASGCAMVLNLAKFYAVNRPKCSVAFMFFAGEEVGLLGSEYYTKNPLFPLSNIKFVLNMDIMGTGEDGITVVNGTVFKKEFDKLQEINKAGAFIKDVKIRGKSANSDHYHFAEKGVKAFFIYTMGGIKAYHDIYDKAETLPLNEFEDLFKLITSFGQYLETNE